MSEIKRIKSQEEYDLVMEKQIQVLMRVAKISKKQAIMRMEAFKKSGIYERYHLDTLAPDDTMYQVVIDIAMSIPQLINEN